MRPHAHAAAPLPPRPAAGAPLSKADLVPAGLVSEATVSGYHADNIAPAIMGGFVLVRSYAPLTLVPLSYGARRPAQHRQTPALSIHPRRPRFSAPPRAHAEPGPPSPPPTGRL